MLLIDQLMSYRFKITILDETCIKMCYFYWKITKIAQIPMASDIWGGKPLSTLSIEKSWLCH